MQIPTIEENSCHFICCNCKTKLWEYFQFKNMCKESDLFFKQTNIYDFSKENLCNETYESMSFLDEIVKESSIVEEAWCTSSPVLSEEISQETVVSQTIMVLQELTTPQNILNNNGITYFSEPKDYDLGGSRVENIDDNLCFATPEKVLQHNESIECIDNGQFICDHCNKVCLNRNSLRKHLKAHTDPEFSCQICGKLYKRSENLKAHLRSHGQPTLTCNKCNASFKYHASYHYHIKNVQ